MSRDAYDDDRVVVVDRGRDSGLGMLLLGLAIGAGAALLLAPASGRETRERLQQGARRASKRAREFAEDMGEDLTERVGRVKERARDAVGTRADAVRDAVEVGREAAQRARADLERNLADAKSAYADRRRSTEPTAADDAGEG
ncbi:MAG: YtxH domain-containing protein [Gemmatimonadaceae bacterium]|nr:YtxH domain-containing protein [Gemmatimonadaceae bacterium]